MLTYNEILAIVYLQLIGIGFIGNCILLFLNTFSFLIIYRRLKNLIIIQLAFSNAMLLLFRGMPTITRLLRVKCLLDNFGIRIITYMQTIPRGLSLGSTCLLSAFQAITISPNNSIWAQLKMKISKFTNPCILLCWVFNLLLDVVVPIYYTGSKNSTDIKDGCNTGYRIIDMYDQNHMMFAIITCVHDYLFLFLMTCSSAYMILILDRHKKHVKHIHSNSHSIKISAETRATQAILFLVGTFILFNVFSPILILHMLYFKYTNNWVTHSSNFLSLGYPTVSPFILISIDNKMLKSLLTDRSKGYIVSHPQK
ncbi:vomeronasal type-1 receptor 4-like [Gracilinanus agilis]|uniref:vomeronasal type-1 receptor 4-like n=1 Tax=Gracilinanus agilis TaxID=191870 RepID=UPI001CFEB112|nr:vomeronasal type-1 receptor 4-like [Gracilinanus agilis]